MSHFCGLVILTPEYAKAHGMDESLAKYDESKEMPEYRKRDVKDSEIIDFLEAYLYGKEADAPVRADYEAFKKSFVKFMRGKKGFFTEKQFDIDFPRNKGGNAYVNHLIYKNEDRYAEYFKAHKPEVFAQFPELYKKHGEDWDGNAYRLDENGVWAVYSTYNPDSKWDWYTVGGRWRDSIKTKDGEFVDMCKFGEIDFEPYPEDSYEDGTDWLGNPCKKLKDGLEWHYDNKDNFPFCIVIDGVWCEKGEMGWWACVSNEKDPEDWHEEVKTLLAKLPADSFVYNVDFHI